MDTKEATGDKQRRSESDAEQRAWSAWKTSNRFGILAEDSDISYDTEDDTPDPASASTPTSSPPSSPSGLRVMVPTTPTSIHQESGNSTLCSRDTPGMDSSLGEDAITPRVAKMDPTSDADSAIHSGEDEPREPQPWADSNHHAAP